MNTIENGPDVHRLIEAATGGDESALAELFSRYKSQLRAMIAFRMDRRLKGRVDPSDILQDAYFDLAKRLPEFGNKKFSFFVWLRMVAKERLLKTHRDHLVTQKRSADREVHVLPASTSVTSDCLANHLVAQYTSIVGKAIKAERSVRLKAVLDQMEEDDREIIALRIFEGLTNGETAEVLGLTKQTVSKRFIRAIGRLQCEIKDMDGFNPTV
jgi:RNA polymerase sigma-70 factor (ECF subfamily)